jgi:hypothetical protein
VALSRENRRDITRWLFPRIMIPLVVIAVVLGTMLLRILENEQVHRVEALRREIAENDDRIRQEECLINPLNATIRHRINERRPEVQIPLCTQFEHLPDLYDKGERLRRQLADLDG